MDFPLMPWITILPPLLTVMLVVFVTFYLTNTDIEDLTYEVAGKIFSVLSAKNYCHGVAMLMVLNKVDTHLVARKGYPVMLRPWSEKPRMVVFEYSAFPRTDELISPPAFTRNLFTLHALMALIGLIIMIVRNI
jgi:hypothetical protein